jgi:hypothetical protein
MGVYRGYGTGALGANPVQGQIDTLSADIATINDRLDRQQTSFRNKFMNGNFDIWQRELYTSSSSQYVADRWYGYPAYSGNTGTLSRQAFAVGQTEVPGYPTYFQRIEVTGNGGGTWSGSSFAQYVPMKDVAGKTVTISFWAKAPANGMKVICYIFHGQNDSFGPYQPDIFVPFTLTNTWQKHTATVDIAPIMSWEPENIDDYVQFDFYVDHSGIGLPALYLGSRQLGSFDFAQLQVEEGSVATDFEERPIALELALCQRHYYQETLIMDAGYAGAGGFVYTEHRHPQQLRKVVAPALSDHSYSNASGLVVNHNDVNKWRSRLTVTALGTGSVTYTAKFNAEL